ALVGAMSGFPIAIRSRNAPGVFPARGRFFAAGERMSGWSARLPRRRHVSRPRVGQALASVALDPLAAGARGGLPSVWVEQLRECVGAEWLAEPVSPRRLLDLVQLLKDRRCRQVLLVPVLHLAPDVPQVGEETLAGGPFVGLGVATELLAGIPGSLRPVAAGSVGDSDERLPYVGLAVLDWQVGLRFLELVELIGHPGVKSAAQPVELRQGPSAPELAHRLSWGTPAHPHDNGAVLDGVRQVTDTTDERHRERRTVVPRSRHSI